MRIIIDKNWNRLTLKTFDGEFTESFYRDMSDMYYPVTERYPIGKLLIDFLYIDKDRVREILGTYFSIGIPDNESILNNYIEQINQGVKLLKEVHPYLTIDSLAYHSIIGHYVKLSRNYIEARDLLDNYGVVGEKHKYLIENAESEFNNYLEILKNPIKIKTGLAATQDKNRIIIPLVVPNPLMELDLEDLVIEKISNTDKYMDVTWLGEFRSYINFCYGNSVYPEFGSLSPLQRAYILDNFGRRMFLSSKFSVLYNLYEPFNPKNFDISNEVDRKILAVKSSESDLGINYGFEVNISSSLQLELMLLLSNQTPIKKCANCNKYFIPEARENEIYCDRVHDNGKTCKQLGWTKKEKAKEYKEYRKTYIAFKAFLKRNEDKYNSYECKTSLKQIFNTWNEIAKDKKEKLNPRILSYSEYKKQVEKYITWIDNSYDKIKELLNDNGDYATFAYICDLDEEGVRAWLAKL